jgi:ubiquitin-protein ligase/Ran GTPase-activating protein (RanGAP) involved in mRNA processing and transport
MKAKTNRNTSILRTMASTENQNFSTRRLLKDFKELQSNKLPNVNVSCVPMDNDLFTWHGNLIAPKDSLYKSGVFHFEIVFPSDYPKSPPTVTLFTNIEHPNVFGSKICLNMLEASPKKETQGWNSAYTIQSILLQLQSFLFEYPEPNLTEKETKRLNERYKPMIAEANEFECHGCSHRGKVNPYPTFKDPSTYVDEDFRTKKSPLELFEESLVCFHTKLTYKENSLGIGLNVDRIARTGAIQDCSPIMDLVSIKAFMKEGIRKSFLKEHFGYWIPLYLRKDDKEKTIHMVKQSLSFIETSSTERFEIGQIERIVPKIIASIVLKIVDLKRHPSCLVIQQLVFFHGLMLMLLREHPAIRESIEAKLESFIKNESARLKENCPNIILILVYLMFTDKYTFTDVIEAYSAEQIDRQVFWILQKIPELIKDNNFVIDDNRAEVTFKSQAISYTLVTIYHQYLKAIRGQFTTWDNLLVYLESNFCKLPEPLENSLQQSFKHSIEHLDSFDAYYESIGMKTKSKAELTVLLKNAIVSSKTKKYHGCEEELNLIPQHPQQMKEVLAGNTKLTDFIKENKIEAGTEQQWRTRCLERWTFVERYSNQTVKDEVTPGEIAEIVDGTLGEWESSWTDPKDIKEYYSGKYTIPSSGSFKPKLLPSHYKDLSWRQLYIKLDIEEAIMFLNKSEEPVGLYSSLEAAAKEVACLNIRFTQVDHLKSKYHYICKVFTYLVNLKVANISMVGVEIMSTKSINSLLKGLLNFKNAGGVLEKISFSKLITLTDNKDDSRLWIQVFDLLKDVKSLEVIDSNLLKIKEGEMISTYIIDNTNLVEINFTNSVKSEKIAQLIADGLMRNKRIESLTLNNNQDMPNSINNIVYNLSFSSKLRYLSLSSCNLKAQTVFVDNLQKFFSINSSVETVILSNLAIQSFITEDLLKSIARNQTVSTLDISSTTVAPISKSMAAILGICLAVNAHKNGLLRNLYLSGILNEDSLNMFVSSLFYTKEITDQWYGGHADSCNNSVVAEKDIEKKFICNLEVLDVSNCAMGKGSFKYAYWNKLRTNASERKKMCMPRWLRLFTLATSLKHLSFKGSNVSSSFLDGIKFVLEFGLFLENLEHIPCLPEIVLQSLDLSKNPLEKEGGKVLEVIIPKLKRLNSIDLSFCKLGVSGAAAIFKIVNETGLANLNLFSNKIDVDGVRALAKVLKDNKTLQCLDLGYNRIKDEGLKQLGSSLTGSNIKYLCIRYNHIKSKAFEQFLDNIQTSKVKILLVKNNDIDDFFLNGYREKMKSFANLKIIDSIFKLNYFSEERLSRTIWVSRFTEANIKSVYAHLKKSEPNSCVHRSPKESVGQDCLRVNRIWYCEGKNGFKA